MPDTTPNVDAPLWGSEQASPWLPHNQAIRIFDAFAAGAIIEDRDLLDPPASCADGARFLIDGAGINDWLGHDDELAIAVGANASNGWYFATVALEGMLLYVRDEGLSIRFTSGLWGVDSSGATLLSELLDVDISGLNDGYVLKFDSSNATFYFGPDLSGLTADYSTLLTVSGTSYDLANVDQGKYIRFTSSSAKTVNVRLNSTEALTINGEWHFRNAGISDLEIVPVGGVTINPPVGGTLTIEPGGTVTLKSIVADEFDLMGATLPLASS